MVPSPDGSLLAITNHQFQLLVVAVASGELKLVDESAFGQIDGPSWSPDGKWVAYSYPGQHTHKPGQIGRCRRRGHFCGHGGRVPGHLPLVRPDRELPLLPFAPDL